MSNDEEEKPSSKVARVIDDYDLDGWGEELERRWTGIDGERTSLRDLADELNQAVLKAALDEAGVTETGPEVSTTYRLLTSDDVSRSDRRRKERNLEQAGVNLDAIRSDFITHQAVHTYLTSYRGTELPDKSTNRPEREAENLRRLQGRTAAVAQSTLDRLIDQDDLTDRDYQLFADVRVICEDCGSSYDIDELLRQGGCECDVSG